MNIAVIPARGGSKRIAKKNIRNFHGRPLIYYSIQAAINSELFEHIIVSTDDLEIANYAIHLGAEVPFVRPDSLSDDYTGTNTVVKHAIQWFEKNIQSVDYVCCIYPTAPFIQVEFLKKGLKRLRKTNKSFAFSVSTFDFPIQRAIKINQNRDIEPFNKNDIKKRSQDLDEAYHDAGQFYWGTRDAFIKEKKMFSPDSDPVIIPRYFVQDIDTREDWKRAELMYQALILSGDIID
jgi:N-acylneuraminate cytidylyltransferase